MCPSSAVWVSAPPAACPEPSRGTPTTSSTHTAQDQHSRAPGQHPWAPQVTPIHPSTPSRVSAHAGHPRGLCTPTGAQPRPRCSRHLPTPSNTSPNAPAAPKMLQHCPHAPNVPAASLMLQHFSKSSSIRPILQYLTPSTPTSLQCSSIPPNTPAPHDKCSSVSVNALASAQTLQHPHPKSFSIPPNTPKSPQILQHLPKHSSNPQKAPASPQHRALMPPPRAPHIAPHWAQPLAAFGAATTQLGQEGLTPRTPGSWDTATGGRCKCPLSPAPSGCPGAGRRLLSRLWPGPCCREEGENIWSQGRGTSPGKNAELLEEALTAAAGVEQTPASLLHHSCTGEGKLRHGGARHCDVGSRSRERQGHPQLPGWRSIAHDL